MKLTRRSLRQLIESVLLENKDPNLYPIETQPYDKRDGEELIEKETPQSPELRRAVVGVINVDPGITLQHVASSEYVSEYRNIGALGGKALMKRLQQIVGGELDETGMLSNIKHEAFKSLRIDNIVIYNESEDQKTIAIVYGTSGSATSELVKIPQDPEIKTAIMNRVNIPDRNRQPSPVVLSFINKPVEKVKGYKSYMYKDINGSSQAAIIGHLNSRLGSKIGSDGDFDEIELGGYRGVGIEVYPDGTVGIYVPE